MFDVNILGSRLRELRQSRKLSLKDVADGIGSKKSSIGNIERGGKPASLAMVISLAEFYNVSIDYLLGASDLPRPLPAHIQEIINEAKNPEELLNALNRVTRVNKDNNKTGNEAVVNRLDKIIKELDDESLNELQKYIDYLKVRQTLSQKNDESSAGSDTDEEKENAKREEGSG